jgi:hypothetical protein
MVGGSGGWRDYKKASEEVAGWLVQVGRHHEATLLDTLCEKSG